MSEAIERHIREIIAMEVVTARALSDALFGIDGLFNKLANSPEERVRISQSPLFRQAQDRLTELIQAEADEWREDLAKRCRARPAKRQLNSQIPPGTMSQDGVGTSSTGGVEPSKTTPSA